MKSKTYTPLNKTREELIDIFESNPFANNSELGEILNVSRERIRQLKKQFGVVGARDFNPDVFRAALKCIETGVGGLSSATFSSIPNFSIKKLNKWMQEDPEVRRQVMNAKEKAYQKAHFPTHKVCVICDIKKPISEFYPDKKTRDRHNRKCNPCNIANVKSYYEKRQVTEVTVDYKICSMLKELGPLPASFFYKSTKTSTGLQYSCKQYMTRYSAWKTKYQKILQVKDDLTRNAELRLLGDWKEKARQEALNMTRKDLEEHNSKVDVQELVG